jgi:hypothetical protein
VNGEFLLGLIAAGAAFGGALLGAGGAVIAGRSQASAARYQADAPWIRELLPSLCAEFLLQAEQVYQGYQAMYEDAFHERWDEMERRARELDPQRLKRALAALELRAPIRPLRFSSLSSTTMPQNQSGLARYEETGANRWRLGPGCPVLTTASTTCS